MSETIWRDLRYAVRTLGKNPAFAATAVLTLGLGIGGNTAIFTVIRAVLLKPLAYREPDRLARLSIDDLHTNVKDAGFNQVRYEGLKSAAKSFSDLGAFFISTEDMTLSGAAEPEALKVARVSANFLDILGVQPALGRGFLPEEDAPGAAPVAMISAELWQRRFGADPAIAGRIATLQSTPYTIVGVLPAGFQFPTSGVDAWVTKPSEFSALPPRQWRFVTILVGLARLKPGVSLDQARAEMDVLARQYAAANPGASQTTMRVARLQDQLVANVRPMLWTLFGAVGFVLLIACANVASLLLARATSRSGEFALRAALGAPRSRLIGQLLAESLLLALSGGVLGVVIAKWGTSAIVRSAALALPRSGEVRLDATVLAFTVAISAGAGVLFGLVPSLKASRPDVAQVLRASGERAGQAPPRGRFGLSTRGLLVVLQVALSVILLIGAALLMESFARLSGVDPGFRRENLLTMQIALPTVRYNDVQKQRAFFESLVGRVSTLPGVRSATVMRTLPMTARYATAVAVAEQPPIDPKDRPSAQLQTVTPDYFRTLGIPLRRGREFDSHDQPEAGRFSLIVNESFARLFWPQYPRGQDPVGQHVLLAGTQRAAEIVGIVADVHERSLDVAAIPEIYIPLATTPLQTAALAVRTEGQPRLFVNSIRAQVLAIDQDQAVSHVKTMEEAIQDSVGQRRVTLVLLGSFAGVALLLAIVGIYGVVAYSVAQRTQEMGIRRALGAQRVDILRLVLKQGLGLALAGVAIGMGGAFALTRVMQSLLFHVSATDPPIFTGIAMLFVLVALAASYVPARRATRIDPMAALR